MRFCAEMREIQHETTPGTISHWCTVWYGANISFQTMICEEMFLSLVDVSRLSLLFSRNEQCWTVSYKKNDTALYKNKFDSKNDASNECGNERIFLNLLEITLIYLNLLKFTGIFLNLLEIVVLKKTPYERTDGRMDWQTGGLTDGWTDGQTDGQTDGWTKPLIEMRWRI